MSTPAKSATNGRHRVQVRLLQVHPIQPDARLSDRIRRFALNDAHPSIILGRASKNRHLVPGPSNLWLESPIITKEHARFIRGPSTQQPLLLRDLNSTHGTHVAGIKIRSDTVVGDGDIIKFGDHITNGPLQFEPPTFLVEYDVFPVSSPPTPESSSPLAPTATTFHNHFGAPDEQSDSESILNGTDARDCGNDPAVATESIDLEEQGLVNIYSEEESMAEPSTASRPFSAQVPSTDTSESEESDQESEEDGELTQSDEVASPSLPPTQGAQLRHPRCDTLYRRCNMLSRSTDGDDTTLRTDLMDISNVITGPDSSRFDSDEGIRYRRDSRFVPRGSSPEHLILLDDSDPQACASAKLDVRVVRASSPPKSQKPEYTLPEDSIEPISTSALPIPQRPQRITRHPSPSDAALARPQELTMSHSVTPNLLFQTPMHRRQAKEQISVGPTNVSQSSQPQLVSIPHAYTGATYGSILSLHPQHGSSVYTDGPFKAPQESIAEQFPEPMTNTGRSRSSGLAIQELIHPSVTGDCSLKRARADYESEEEDAMNGPGEAVENKPMLKLSEAKLLGPTLDNVIKRMTFHRPSRLQLPTSRNAVVYHDDLMPDDEIDDDALDYENEEHDVNLDPGMLDAQMFLSSGRTDLGQDVRTEAHGPNRQIQALKDDNQSSLGILVDMQQTVGVLDAGDQMASNDLSVLLEDDGPHLPELAPPILEDARIPSPPVTGVLSLDKPDFVFGDDAASPEAVSLSHDMTRAAGKDTDSAGAPPRKKSKTNPSPNNTTRPRFKRFMNKAVPFMAGAMATAATIFAGAGVLISTMHDELRQEALFDLGV